MLELGLPSAVDGRPGHFWFPAIHVLAPDTLLCLVPEVPDVGESLWRSRMFRRKGAGAWQDIAEVPYGSASVRREKGLLVLPYEFWPAASARSVAGAGFFYRQDARGGHRIEERQVTVEGFRRDVAAYVEGKAFLIDSGDDVLRLRGGTLFHTLYGRLEGDRRYRLFAVVSDDEGLTWRYRATVADGQRMRVREGPSEAATVRLDDGSLLCVFRVDSGAGAFFGRSVSRDEGRTWKRLRPMPGKGSVKPQFARLADGTILLTGGRPGIYLWMCTDGLGRRWRRYDLVDHHNRAVVPKDRFPTSVPGDGEVPAASTCYTSMRPVGPQEVLIAYERLGNGWSGSSGVRGSADVVYCLRAKVGKSPGRSGKRTLSRR